MNCYPRAALLALFAVIACWNADITRAEAGDSSEEQHAAIRAAGKAYIDALNRADKAALAAMWTEKGVYVDAAGKAFAAHELIEQHFGDAAATQNLEKVPVDSQSTIRLVTDDVAVEEGTSRTVIATGDEVVTGGYSAVWVMKGNRWLLDTLREWESSDIALQSPLKVIEWIIGDWVSESDGIVVTSSAEWCENERFILRRFTIKQDGVVLQSGTQRIGWDPAAQSIRSWTFDSHGGIIEGLWHHEAGAWIIKTAGVTANGSRTTGATFLIPEGDDHCVVKSSHVMVGDVEVPDSETEFHRLPAD